MNFRRLEIPELVLVEPRVHGDKRGYFVETWRQERYAGEGIGPHFVQDNESSSGRWVLRGLHYQLRRPQGKLVRVVSGRIFDVGVDLRRDSATFGRWAGIELSGEDKRQLWIPPGFAHGFLVLSESARIAYKCTDYYAPDDERTLAWNDPEVAIDWPLPVGTEPIVSEKDAGGVGLGQADTYS